MREKLKERTKIGTKSELYINFSEYVPPESEVTPLVYKFFAHKRDFGATFGIGFVKTTKQTPFWIYFFNQGFFTKTKFVAPFPLQHSKLMEVVVVLD